MMVVAQAVEVAMVQVAIGMVAVQVAVQVGSVAVMVKVAAEMVAESKGVVVTKGARVDLVVEVDEAVVAKVVMGRADV